MRTLAVIHAEYVDGYRLRIQFSDGTKQIVDFGEFLQNHPHPQHNLYRHLDHFKKFHIERGNVVWGEDWDLIFLVSQLHQGYVVSAVY